MYINDLFASWMNLSLYDSRSLIPIHGHTAKAYMRVNLQTTGTSFAQERIDSKASVNLPHSSTDELASPSGFKLAVSRRDYLNTAQSHKEAMRG